jgi:hypothetical protein
MKKTSFVVAILVSALLAACGGKKTPAAAPTGDMGSATAPAGSGDTGSAAAGSGAGSAAM